MTRWLWCQALLLLLSGSVARAEGALSYENTFVVRANPLGLGDELVLRYRLPLYASTRPALAQNFFGIVTPILLAPSLVRPGLGVELQPLSLVRLYFGYEPSLTFGAVGALHSYPTPAADYGFGAFQLGGPPVMPGELYATVVHQVVLAATVQLAHRWFAFRSTWRAQWVDAALHGGDTVFYDQLYGLLLPQSGWMLHGETDALYRSRFGLTAGIHYILTTTWYPDAQPNPNAPIQKLGPIVAYTFFEHSPSGRFDAPTLFLLATWYLEDRYRAGQLVSQAIPMIALGFSFRGNLFDPTHR